MAGPLSYALSLSTRAFTAPLSAAKGALGGFKSVAGGTAGVLAKVVGPLGAIASGAALAATAMKSLSVASKMEQTEVGLKSLIGDMATTKKLLADVKALSASTPFEFPEFANSTRSLVAMDMAVEKIPETLRRIGDVASGVQTPISELALLYGRAKNDGLLYTETLNQMNDRGIPVFTELAKMMGKSVPEIKKMASEGKITFPLLEQSFINLTKEGGKFHGMMAAQSETNAGLISTLKDGFTDLMLIVGTPINDALKPILKEAIGLVKRIGLGLGGMVDIAKAAIAQGKLGELLSMGLMIGLKEAANYGAGLFVFMGEVLFKSMTYSFKQSILLFSGGFNEAIGNIFGGLVKVITGLGKIILSKLGEPFRTVAAYFQAGLAKAVNFLLAELGSTKLGQMLGISVDHESFEDLLAASKQLMGKDALAEGGAADMKEGFTQAAKGFGDAMVTNFNLAKEVFAGTKFEKVDIFDLKGDQEAMKLLSTKLSPEGMAKLMESLLPTAEKLDDAAGKTKDATDKAEGIAAAIAAANAPKPEKDKKSKKKDDKKGRKRIKLYDAAESFRRRFARQSSADKGTFKDFANNGGSNRAFVSNYAKKQGITFDEAVTKLGRGANAAGKQRPGRKSKDGLKQDTQDTMLGVLKDIDGRLDNLAIA